MCVRLYKKWRLRVSMDLLPGLGRLSLQAQTEAPAEDEEWVLQPDGSFIQKEQADLASAIKKADELMSQADRMGIDWTELEIARARANNAKTFKGVQEMKEALLQLKLQNSVMQQKIDDAPPPPLEEDTNSDDDSDTMSVPSLDEEDEPPAPAPTPDPPDPALDEAPCPDRDRPPGDNPRPPCDRPDPAPAPPAPAPEPEPAPDTPPRPDDVPEDDTEAVLEAYERALKAFVDATAALDEARLRLSTAEFNEKKSQTLNGKRYHENVHKNSGPKAVEDASTDVENARAAARAASQALHQALDDVGRADPEKAVALTKRARTLVRKMAEWAQRIRDSRVPPPFWPQGTYPP